MDAFQKLNDKGITIAMVTHEPDIARYTKRNIVMRDGVIVSDTAVKDRFHATDEMRRLDEEHQAAQLVK
jgi:putative ABC transport system ATP-binding protein